MCSVDCKVWSKALVSKWQAAIKKRCKVETRDLYDELHSLLELYHIVQCSNHEMFVQDVMSVCLLGYVEDAFQSIRV